VTRALAEKYLITVDKNFDKPSSRKNQQEDLKTGDAPEKVDSLVVVRDIREALWPV
jgi:hypothetical protein